MKTLRLVIFFFGLFLDHFQYVRLQPPASENLASLTIAQPNASASARAAA
jgi:hypothetical protein